MRARSTLRVRIPENQEPALVEVGLGHLANGAIQVVFEDHGQVVDKVLGGEPEDGQREAKGDLL